MNLLSSLFADGIDMNFEYVSSVVVTGLTVVFLCLILLVIILFLFGLVSKARRKSAEKRAESKIEEKSFDLDSAKTQIVKTVPDIEDGIEEEIVAVITAAVLQMSENSGKRISLKSIKAAKTQRTAWAAAGIIDNTRPF